MTFLERLVALALHSTKTSSQHIIFIKGGRSQQDMDLMEIGFSVTTLLIILAIAWKIWNDKSGIDLNPIINSNTQVSETYTQMTNEYSSMQTILGELNATLEGARTDNVNIQQFGRDLRDVLLKPSIRGDVGEKLLEEMCSANLADHLWERQRVTDEESDSQRGGVDVLIKYSKINLPVDSKFPREAWRRYINLADSPMSGKSEDEIKNHKNKIKNEWDDFRNSINAKVKEIQKHINPPGTTDFGLMFIPSEAMYYSLVSDKNALNDQNNLLDEMLKKKVIPVSPSIFYAFLEVIKIGVANLAIIDNVEGLRKQVQLFKTKQGTYAASHEKVGQLLKDALDEWETEDARYKELGKKADDIVNALDKVTIDEDSNDMSVQEESGEPSETDLTTQTEVLENDEESEK